MKCERGLCLICEKVISHPCESCKTSWKNTEEYTQVQVKWSNGSLMDVAVCAHCAKEAVWKADKKAMTQAIWDAWDKTGGRYNKEYVIV